MSIIEIVRGEEYGCDYSLFMFDVSQDVVALLKNIKGNMMQVFRINFAKTLIKTLVDPWHGAGLARISFYWVLDVRRSRLRGSSSSLSIPAHHHCGHMMICKCKPLGLGWKMRAGERC